MACHLFANERFIQPHLEQEKSSEIKDGFLSQKNELLQAEPFFAKQEPILEG